MAVPRMKKSKAYSLKPPKIEVPRLNRKCRACGRWATVATDEPCSWCGTAYGRLVLGDDLPREVAPAVDRLGFPVAKAEL